MKIEKLNVYIMRLPFSMEFRHSVVKRKFVYNLIVELICENGELKGYGEGAPRPYVTGETHESALKFVTHLISRTKFPVYIERIDQIWEFIDNLPGEKSCNSSVCAIEMAMLDAFARNQKRPVTDYFSHDYSAGKVYYSAVIPMGSIKTIEKICEIIKITGIDSIKLKMGEEPEQNCKSLATVVSILGHDCDIRVDVNGGWNFKSGMKHIPILREYNVRIIEQPMMPGDPAILKFSEETQRAGILLMADESVCGIVDMHNTLNRKSYSMVNIRLSKCGGLMRSLRLAEYMREENIKFQIGCHLGESGLLSAAGRALCVLCRDAVYYEGSYDSYLLEKNITENDVSFGRMGRAVPLYGHGLGINVDNVKFLELTKQV